MRTRNRDVKSTLAHPEDAPSNPPRRLHAVAVISFVVLLAVTTVVPATAMPQFELSRMIYNPDPHPNDFFGVDRAGLTVIGGNILVGARGERDGIPNAGVAYLLDGATGAVLQTYSNPDPDPTNYGFASAVATDAQYVAVGWWRSHYEPPYEYTGSGDTNGDGIVNGLDANTVAVHFGEESTTETIPGDVNGDMRVDGLDVNVIALDFNGSLFDELVLQAGAVFLFDLATGEHLQTFRNPTPEFDERFGLNAAFINGNVLVGAYKDNELGTIAGSATLFDSETGEIIHNLHDPTPHFFDRFGRFVTGFGDDLLVTAYRDSFLGPNSGAAFLFDGDTGELIRTFYNPTPDGHDHFGEHAAVYGNQILIGATDDSNAGAAEAGAADLFDGTTPEPLHTFLNPDPEMEDNFGYTVALSDKYAAICSWKDDEAGLDAGAVYVYDVVTGSLLQKILNPSPGQSFSFGDAMAFLGDELLIRFPGSDVGAENAGALYVFSLTGSPSPEPSSFLLAMLGGIWLLGIRRHRRRRSG